MTHSDGIGAADAWIREHGDRVPSDGTNDATNDGAFAVLLGLVPPSALAELDDKPWAVRVEAPRILHTKMDKARGAATGLDDALARIPGGLTGDGVLVAVVDTGVDWSHPDFCHDNESSRIEKFVYAHRLNGATSTTYEIYSQNDINGALTGSNKIPEGDLKGHGTHCASIAAGNGRGAAGCQYRGVAPNAAIMAVRSEPLYDDHTMRGIADAFNLAAGRPAVVSLSLGTNLGSHDGTSALELAIMRQSGPGRIVVVSAGNEGEDAIHSQGQLVEGQDLVIPFRISDTNLEYVDVWIPRGDDVDIFVETPRGISHQPTGDIVTTADGAFRADFIENPINRDQNLFVQLAGGRIDDVWSIRIRPLTVMHGEVHAWAETANPYTSRHIFRRPSPGYSVGTPATSERCIAVGSSISKTGYLGRLGNVNSAGLTVGHMSGFSSVGPTRAGILKPDIAAPGQFITAALADGSEMAMRPDYAELIHPTAPYITIQGTSMAAPFIAGLIALMLQREPKLTPEEIRHRFRVTSRRDQVTGPVWNPRFGLGKIDAAALLNYRGGHL
ncbi:S8 family serine peptidase [Parafrankia discariae]|uniref:S8 family serine peptidase n=1 Tax=Parafrankia discariae TaxID=365528 RepID=UPI001E36FF51|nr:S8 family serine peptidase [Parafrankia discariae]